MDYYVREWRDYYGISQDDLCKTCSPPLSKKALQGIEFSAVRTHRGTIERIAEALGVTLDDLVAGPPFDFLGLGGYARPAAIPLMRLRFKNKQKRGRVRQLLAHRTKGRGIVAE